MKRTKLTQKQVANLLSACGARLKVNREYGEFVLVIPADEVEYYTDSLEDVVGTAQAYLGTHPNWARAAAALLTSLVPTEVL